MHAVQFVPPCSVPTVPHGQVPVPSPSSYVALQDHFPTTHSRPPSPDHHFHHNLCTHTPTHLTFAPRPDCADCAALRPVWTETRVKLGSEIVRSCADCDDCAAFCSADCAACAAVICVSCCVSAMSGTYVLCGHPCCLLPPPFRYYLSILLVAFLEVGRDHACWMFSGAMILDITLFVGTPKKGKDKGTIAVCAAET